MAPLIPRLHLFEIDDQPWFPSWFRGRVQAALTQAWCFRVPLLQSRSAAATAAQILARELGGDRGSYVVVDFCAGAGGPTPSIEAHLNRPGPGPGPSPPSYAEVAAGGPAPAPAPAPPVHFVLTDLHPHVEDWAAAAAASPNISYEPSPVDAAAAPPGLLERCAGGDGPAGPRKKKVLRLFNLAFHHFPDPLARRILRNTAETSDGFAVLELQARDPAAVLVTLLFGLGILLTAPWYALRWRSPATLFWAWAVPVLPFVLVFDGLVSAARTRTPDEVEALLRACGAPGADDPAAWEVRSGRELHLWPCGYVYWVVGLKRQKGGQ